MKFRKFLVNSILISIILIIFFGIILETYVENNIKEYGIQTNNYIANSNINNSIANNDANNATVNSNTNKNSNVNNSNKNRSVEVETGTYEKTQIESEYRGYDVCAELEIPNISLKTKVLKNYSENALNVSVVKFWGVNPNQIGNCAIVGHNFINQNMFRNLKKLKIGDRFFLTDNEIGKVEYEIFLMDKVLPENVKCLEAVTKNEREVTLITCTNDSKKRIIVKAKEVLD